MDPKKAKELLESKDRLGKWLEVEEKEIDLEVLRGSREGLLKLRELLKRHLEKDIGERDRMHEVLMRLKHGGGV